MSVEIPHTVKVLSLLLVAGAAVMVVGGCSGHRFETGYHDWDKVQVQFYAPTGATVTLGQEACGRIEPDRSHQISAYGAGEHRLELEPEEFSVFNLSPGEYEFKYTAAGGWPGVSVYGSLEIFKVDTSKLPEARKFLRRCFIPIALPSPATVEMKDPSQDMFPYQSATRRLRITNLDAKRLAVGDMVTKVVFLADLQRAKERLDQVNAETVVLDREIERINKLYREARYDWLENPRSRKFIDLEAKRQVLQQKIEKLEETRTRLQALLDADRVLTRRHMLVLATDEILPAHEDPIAAAEELGQVVLVMRVGGRHLHWGNSVQEATAFNK